MTAIRPYLRLAQPDVHHLSAAEQEGVHKALKASVEVVHAPKHEAQPSEIPVVALANDTEELIQRLHSAASAHLISWHGCQHRRAALRITALQEVRDALNRRSFKQESIEHFPEPDPEEVKAHEGRVRQILKDAQAEVKATVNKEREAEKIVDLGRFRMSANDVEGQL